MEGFLSEYFSCFFLLTLAVIFLSCLSLRSPRRIRHTSPESIKALLSTSSLRARALANRRLVHAFNLKNTFVSPDADVHTAFVRRFQALLQTHSRSGSWNRFLEVSSQAVECTLADCLEDYSVFMQAVTLRVAITGLLDVDRDVTALDANDLCVVAELITELWSLSKTADAQSSGILHPSKLACLNDHLRRLLPNSQAYPNPIDFVIPTWETLWRVVAICIAHVRQNEEYIAAFRALNANPDLDRFSSVDSVGAGVSAKAIIMECLRLYPPSKHISRWQVHRHRFMSCLPEGVARIFDRVQVDIADVHSVHHSSEIWGLDVKEFNPSRHDIPSSTAEHTAAFLPFGSGPLQCSGRTWAPMAIGCIVAAILDKMESDEMIIRAGDCIGGRAGWDGWFVEKVL